jgi:hypothetical protein
MTDVLKLETELENIVKKVDGMDKLQHIELGKILMKDKLENNVKIEFNEKNDGLRINLSRLSPSIINKIQLYISKYDNVTNVLDKLDETSAEIKDTYFN